MVRCQTIIAHLSEYLDKEATLETRDAIEAHLRGCLRCNAVYDSTRKLLVIAGDRRICDLPAGFSARLHRFLDQTVLGPAPSCAGRRQRLHTRPPAQ